MKRLLDIWLSAIGIVALGLPLAAIALWIKLDSRGPLLYRGERVGRHGRRFRIAKFRTMVVDADQIGGSSTADDDPRITRAGHWLRRLKLDELPQLFNVFMGTMSFVGPRPQVQWAVDLYSEAERDLLSVRPGITDYASLAFRNEGEILRGSSDPDADYLKLIAPRKNRLALEYVHRHNVITDLKVITATVLAIAGVDPLWCQSPDGKVIIKQFEQEQQQRQQPQRAAA
ncbi:sugar transferase [Roseimaritima ulvae]|uniref:Undecaprenyl-phosphate N-acetylgalactosaminyl 1-phosphate transferase n=1 Tax=Roseimaritima ulvae TaxID=980254 RepID=A0A5B9QVA8_9BACT|nr:sugar transferase [Roseimaritima ulvae]QEG42977.1 Putative undecaprenyl-phosphate N-acetylgalactosaminyl 1-phosphate transferase [Roseimaritima ulvae]